jgi:IS5 family transposase
MAKKVAANEMGQRAIDALYHAGEDGETGEALIPEITTTGNDPRAWRILLDLVEAGRVERAGVGEDARYQLTDEERDAEFERRFFLNQPPPTRERGNV